jgi:hypothetical protein
MTDEPQTERDPRLARLLLRAEWLNAELMRLMQQRAKIDVETMQLRQRLMRIEAGEAEEKSPDAPLA